MYIKMTGRNTSFIIKKQFDQIPYRTNVTGHNAQGDNFEVHTKSTKTRRSTKKLRFGHFSTSGLTLKEGVLFFEF